MKRYFIGLKICDHYTVHIIEDVHHEEVMVKEDNLEGFIQCLKHFGYE